MHSKWPVVAVVAIIVVTTLASGPLVGAVDLTNEPDRPAFGHGNVTISNADLPTNATLRKARFGAGGYELRVPSATVDLENVTGYPRLVYEVEIPELGYSRSTTHSPPPDEVRSYTLTIERGTLETDDIEASSYAGTVSIARMADHEKHEIVSGDVTVEVVE